MSSEAAMYDEFAAALQFPWYFGNNRDAFADCLTDLAWLAQGAGYVWIVARAHLFLADAGAEVRQWVAECFDDVRRFWAEPVEEGDSWDRPAVACHVVLQFDPHLRDDVGRLWAPAATSLPPLR